MEIFMFYSKLIFYKINLCNTKSKNLNFSKPDVNETIFGFLIFKIF